MTGATWFDRAEGLRRLADDPFDVLVVGGGITGVGTALDAASRGLRTALVERDDFASGTSSKSSKLAHGGLRYLQQGEIRLVYEALHERQRMIHNAPHLVKLLPFLLPVFKGSGGVINKKLARALGMSMWMYDLTGGARIGRFHERLSPEEVLAHMPTLPADKVASSYLYHDATVDDARLCVTVARTAAIEFGAVAVNGASLVGIAKDASGRVSGATVRADGRDIEVRCSAIVNAAGVWSDEVRTLDEGHDPDSIRPAKGIHITVPWEKVRNDIAVVVPVPKDKRAVFVVPWGDLTYIGTTDTDYDGPNEDPPVTREDVDYLLGALRFTGITDRDVLGTWAGLRPLVKSASSGRTADLSRRHAVVASPSGVVSVTGGKLTTYREMAADTVDEVVDQLGSRVSGIARRSRTRSSACAAPRATTASPRAPIRRSPTSPTGTAASPHRPRPGGGRPHLREPLVAGLPTSRPKRSTPPATRWPGRSTTC
ncbi:MAG: FAD-dependent oxidoreductase [Acidimicrobiales bacterium]